MTAKTGRPLGRPPGDDPKVKMNVYFRALERDRLAALAEKEGTTRAELVEQIVKRSLSAKFHRKSCDFLLD